MNRWLWEILRAVIQAQLISLGKLKGDAPAQASAKLLAILAREDAFHGTAEADTSGEGSDE